MRDAARCGYAHLAQMRGIKMIELDEIRQALPNELAKLKEIGDYL